MTLSVSLVELNNMCVFLGEKPFLCEADGCGRSFAEFSSLRKHMLVHSGEWDTANSWKEDNFLLIKQIQYILREVARIN